MKVLKSITLQFTVIMIATSFATSSLIIMLLKEVYAEGKFVPFVRKIPPNLSYPPSDIAWTGIQFIITTVDDGLLNTVSTKGKLSSFAPNCFKIEGYESHIAIAGKENYKFGVGNIYVSNGPLIWRIDPTGSKCSIFANLSSPQAPFLKPTGYHTQLTFDTQGSFDKNLIVSTGDGSIWTLDYKGNSKLLASKIGDPLFLAFGSEILECLDVAPANFGPYGGTLIVGAQHASKLYSISKSGEVSPISFVIEQQTSDTALNEQCHFLPSRVNTTDRMSGMYISFFSQGSGGNNLLF